MGLKGVFISKTCFPDILVSIPGGNQASKKPAPVPQKPQPKIGRQMSRELEKTQQPSGESEEDKELIGWYSPCPLPTEA